MVKFRPVFGILGRLSAGSLLLLMSNFFLADAQPSAPELEGLSISGANWATISSLRWRYNGTEQIVNGRPAKISKLDGNFSTQGYYVEVQSAIWNNPSDPLLYYLTTAGVWTVLSDDEGGYPNFKTVVHFNGSCSQNVSLAFTHYDSSYRNDYSISETVWKNDPQRTNCYYLEVYPNGTIQKVWR